MKNEFIKEIWTIYFLAITVHNIWVQVILHFFVVSLAINLNFYISTTYSYVSQTTKMKNKNKTFDYIWWVIFTIVITANNTVTFS